MYDPKRRPGLADMGSNCPGCGLNLLATTVEVKDHPSGSGLTYPCPKCGVQLHENPWQYVFFAEPNREHRTFSVLGAVSG